MFVWLKVETRAIPIMEVRRKIHDVTSFTRDRLRLLRSTYNYFLYAVVDQDTAQRAFPATEK